MILIPRPLFVLGTILFAITLHADDVGGRQVLLGPGANPAGLTITTNTDRQTWRFDGDALEVTVVPGKKATPTLFIAPAEDTWDLSAHGHIEATITNPDITKPLRIELRVDNAGDWRKTPWNIESTRILPGKTTPLKVIFGHHYGYNPGYKLDAARVSKVALYFADSEHPVTYRIESIIAAGPAGETPPIDPRKIRHIPPEGHLLGGADVTLDEKQIEARGGAQATIVQHAGQSALDVTLPASGASTLAIVPPQGAWDLSNSTNVAVTFTNTGDTPVTPSFFLQNGNRDEATDTYATDTPLAPGKSATVTLAYAARDIWQGPQGDLTQHAARRGTNGSKFKSEKAARIAFTFAHTGDARLRIDAIRAVTLTAPLPDWVGQRPPAPGDWEISFRDEFDGDTLNTDVWEPTGPNWWGEKKVTRYSKDNVIIGGGTVRLRVEKRPGWHLDDPATKHHADYAAGILRTYGKWTQKYGYFEARMKLPEKAALWPAFWLMPDRGESAGEQWKRQNIGDGGMELDIMEHLTRWGPYRYTTAMHWDGYGKDHKATGASVYFNPTPDGYVTSGVLWLPGELTYYVNGRAVAHWKHERIGNIASEILFTMPLGGWDNEKRPIDAELPADFIIDYVRVWQRADLR
ncbi:MAG: family 16 glycosylhydrolase [Verrucomicrobiota bacterium]